MKSFLVCLAGLGVLVGASVASAAELPVGAESICYLVADEAYSSAVLAGDGLPDGAWSSALESCQVFVDGGVQ